MTTGCIEPGALTRDRVSGSAQTRRAAKGGGCVTGPYQMRAATLYPVRHGGAHNVMRGGYIGGAVDGVPGVEDVVIDVLAVGQVHVSPHRRSQWQDADADMQSRVDALPIVRIGMGAGGCRGRGGRRRLPARPQ